MIRYKGHLYRVAGGSCPIRSRLYGGILGGGGFGTSTEWEVGAQRAAEAAHCILGSLGKWTYGGDPHWDKMLRIEREHILEEMDIIEYVLKEYAKPLYVDRINDALEGGRAAAGRPTRGRRKGGQTSPDDGPDLCPPTASPAAASTPRSAHEPRGCVRPP